MTVVATERPSPLATLHPAYFAMVMATGIVSIAAQLEGFAGVARALFLFNLLAAVVLVVLTLARISRYRKYVVADLLNHGRVVGFFTMVAAVAVVGSQMLLVVSAWRIAAALWFVAVVLWALLTYSIFTILTIKRDKPTLAEGINGGWLVSVVAPQSVAVLGAQLAPGFGDVAPTVLLFSLTMWLGAGMVYVWIISLIFYRYTFFSLSPSDLAPPYWINMGAAAISTLAGTALISGAPHSKLLGDLMPFLEGLTLAYWATATWWIPMLLTLGAWRHLYSGLPIRYDPLYWGAVFPLGMYTVCTFRLAEALGLPLLFAIPRVTVYIALAAWALTMIGLARQIVPRRLTGRPARTTP